MAVFVCLLSGDSLRDLGFIALLGTGSALADVLLEVRMYAHFQITSAVLVAFVAAIFLGPLAGLGVAAVAVIASATAATVGRLAGKSERGYPLAAVAINIAAVGVPAAVVAAVCDAANATTQPPLVFVLVVAGASLVALPLNLALTALLTALYLSNSLRANLKEALPSVAADFGAHTVLIVVAGLAYLELRVAGALMAIGGALVYAYLTTLLLRAREEAARNRAMSWGMLSALVRTLDARDAGTARHCAAVAMFCADVARHLSLGVDDQELAHTAGLLHDIGKFALSDRILSGAPLEPEDWLRIREHPEIGARLLSELSSYGPIAETVRAHHERIDGLGYPDGLIGDEIPLIARIVSACEVYDTLTADDTYRVGISSFEAMRELQRVAGTQLDAQVVAAIAELIAGRGTDYRHATAADFDRELAKKSLTSAPV